MSSVPSVLQLLTIRYSKFEYVCASTLSMQSARNASPLYTGVNTPTSGVCSITSPLVRCRGDKWMARERPLNGAFAADEALVGPHVAPVAVSAAIADVDV